MIKELAEYIEAELGWTIGERLFAGWSREMVADRICVLVETGGSPYYLKNRVDYTVQVLTRSNSYHEARDDAYAVFNLLHRREGINLGEIGVNVIEAVSVPENIGQDEKNRWEFSTNYILRTSEKI